MDKKYSFYAIGILVVAAFVVGAWVYPHMPALVVSHWGASGQANGYMSRAWGTFLLPLILLLVTGFLVVAPKLDPLRKNITEFEPYYYAFIVVFVVFMDYVYALTLAWNLGYRFDLGRWLLPAMAVLFYGVSVLLRNSRRNWFIGVRTPWTLSSDTVWEKTNRLGAAIFRFMALLYIVWLFVPFNFLVLLPILFILIFGLVAYSYVLYRKEQKA